MTRTAGCGVSRGSLCGGGRGDGGVGHLFPGDARFVNGSVASVRGKGLGSFGHRAWGPGVVKCVGGAEEGGARFSKRL